jgi:hypothetical protein
VRSKLIVAKIPFNSAASNIWPFISTHVSIREQLNVYSWKFILVNFTSIYWVVLVSIGQQRRHLLYMDTRVSALKCLCQEFSDYLRYYDYFVYHGYLGIPAREIPNQPRNHVEQISWWPHKPHRDAPHISLTQRSLTLRHSDVTGSICEGEM